MYIVIEHEQSSFTYGADLDLTGKISG